MDKETAIGVATEFMRQKGIAHLGLKVAFFASGESYRREGLKKGDEWVVHFVAPPPKPDPDGFVVEASDVIIVCVDAASGGARMMYTL